MKQELDDPDTFTFAADLRREDPGQGSGRARAGLGRPIDGLVNNAGGQFPAELKDISLNGWNAVIANNLTATFLVSKEVYRCSMESNGGAIVNVGADWELGMPGMGHNGAARAGQTNFTYTASVEWAHAGVRRDAVLRASSPPRASTAIPSAPTTCCAMSGRGTHEAFIAMARSPRSRGAIVYL